MSIATTDLLLTQATRHIALAGNPNAGKTTLFNALTGMRQKVGNYPGVTVEKKEGRFDLPSGAEVVLLDLPGTYSLSPKSPDEEIARDVLLGLRPDTPLPDAVIVVVDSSNLERNLYFATQVLELGLPCVIALNMTDVARANRKSVDAARLSQTLGAPVVELVALRGEGLATLRAMLDLQLALPRPLTLKLPPHIAWTCSRLATVLGAAQQPPAGSNGAPALDPAAAWMGPALRLLAAPVDAECIEARFGIEAGNTLEQIRAGGLSAVEVGQAEATARYAMLGTVMERLLPPTAHELPRSFTDKADEILTHKVWGLVIFAAITLMVFQAIYSWANYPMNWIAAAVAWTGNLVSAHMPEGPLRELLVQGVIAGVGAVMTFLPQILVLFFFIGILEDTGYMARAAFLMDRMMGRVGLHGRSFIPLLSSFACAIPGIMATRTIASRRDRMTTILIAPLMSCSARLPVYTLMIGTFIPDHKVAGFVSLRAAVMLSMYVLGTAVAMLAALVFKRTLFKGPAPALMLELPPYKIPAWRNVVVTMWDRSYQFVQRAGTVILAISIVLWFMLSYPRVHPTPVASATPAVALAAKNRDAANQLQNSIAGHIGRVVEPLIRPLGFNWKIGIGLIGAMSAREVFVSTMGTVYSVGEADEKSVPLQQALQRDHWPDGRPVWTPLVAISLLVYFVLAMQCVSTMAVVKRETGTWKWAFFMWGYMTGLAWIASFAIYQGGCLMGWN